MKFETEFPPIENASIYTALFAALPGKSILLKADVPKFTIVAATPDYLTCSGYAKKPLIGKGVFEAFPGNDADANNTGDRDLLASLQQVLQLKKAHHLPVQRYDIASEDGGFVEKYWKVGNQPMFGPDGEIDYIIHTAEDITDEIIAEKRERNIVGIEKVFSLFMDAPMVVGLVNGDNYILELANLEAYKLWGKGPAEIIGKPILEGLPEMSGQGIIEIFDGVRSSGKPFFADEVPVRSFVDGKESLHYFNVMYQPYYGGNAEKATGVFTISHDVTEQVLSKQRAEESERKFRTMAEGTPVLIAVSDETGNATYFNKAWTDLTGRPMQALLQRGWTDLVHPEDRDKFVDHFMEAFANKDSFVGEFRTLSAQDEYHWLLAHGVPRVDAQGHFMGHISACTDITEHKRVQRELETALEQVRLSKKAAELGTFDMDLEKGTMHWDDRCRTLFGISHHNRVSYENDFVNGLHPDDRQRIVELIDQLFTNPSLNGIYDVEYRTVGAENGVITWVRAKGKVYFNAEGKPVRFIGSVLDITPTVMALQKIEAVVEERTRELAQTNENLQQSNRELQRSNENLEEFAHAASHDLKEPVRKIHYFTQLLKEQLSGHLAEEERHLFGRMENATERMRTLIDDLLLYSHVSQRPHEMELINLNQKVQNVLQDLELDIAEKKAVIQVQPLPTVKGYRRQLQQVFQNLISNALKYSKADVAPRIVISASEATENGRNYHLISVKDNGIGFEQDYADQIFKMFTRLHGKEEYSGTGVGLSIVKKVIQNHNGFIQVDSVVGEGSVFRIYLPV